MQLRGRQPGGLLCTPLQRCNFRPVHPLVCLPGNATCSSCTDERRSRFRVQVHDAGGRGRFGALVRLHATGGAYSRRSFPPQLRARHLDRRAGGAARSSSQGGMIGAGLLVHPPCAGSGQVWYGSPPVCQHRLDYPRVRPASVTEAQLQSVKASTDRGLMSRQDSIMSPSCIVSVTVHCLYTLKTVADAIPCFLTGQFTKPWNCMSTMMLFCELPCATSYAQYRNCCSSLIVQPP